MCFFPILKRTRTQNISILLVSDWTERIQGGATWPSLKPTRSILILLRRKQTPPPPPPRSSIAPLSIGRSINPAMADEGADRSMDEMVSLTMKQPGDSTGTAVRPQGCVLALPTPSALAGDKEEEEPVRGAGDQADDGSEEERAPEESDHEAAPSSSSR